MRSLFSFGIIVALVFGSLAQADADTEREALSELLHEISALELLVDRAEQAEDPDARIRFRYDWLRQDLERVRRGIEEHVEALAAEPRPTEPLRGDYRR